MNLTPALPTMVGPFTKQNFSQATWQSFEKRLANLQNPHKRELLCEYKILLNFMLKVNACPDYKSYFGVSSIKKYFLSNFFPNVVQNMMTSNSLTNGMLIEAMNKVLLALVALWMKLSNEDSDNLLESLDIVLDPTQNYYNSQHISSNLTDLENRRPIKVVKEKKTEECFYDSLVKEFFKKGGLEKLNIILNKVEPYVNPKIVVLASSITSNTLNSNVKIKPTTYLPTLKIEDFDKLFKKLIDKFLSSFSSLYQDALTVEDMFKELSALLEVIKDIRTGPVARNKLNAFLIERSIFDKIYSSKDYLIFETARPYFEYILKHDILTTGNLELLWSVLIDGNKYIQRIIYSMLTNPLFFVKTAYMEVITSKILEMPFQQISELEVNFFFAFNDYLQSAWSKKQVWTFYWRVMSDEDVKTSYPDLVNLIQNKFDEIVKDSSFEGERIGALYECMENVKNGSQDRWLSKKMRHVLTFFPRTTQSPRAFDRSDLLLHLCRENDLVDLIVEDIKRFKKNFEKKTQEKKLTPEEVESYPDYFVDKLKFLKYIMFEIPCEEVVITEKILLDLWETLVDQSFNSKERTLVYKLFEFVYEFCILYKKQFISAEKLKSFFKQKICCKTFLEKNSYENFMLFVDLFIKTNMKCNLLAQIVDDLPWNPKYNHPNLWWPPIPATDFHSIYIPNEVPSKMIGINTLWDFIFESLDPIVGKEAMDFAKKLYCSKYSDKDREALKPCITDDLLSTCLAHMQNASISTASMVNLCLRCFDIIEYLISYSEKEGYASLNTHFRREEGSIITLKVRNDGLNSRPGIPENVEVQMSSSDTVLDLRVQIGKKFKMRWDEVKICRMGDNTKITSIKNNKTLQEIGLANQEKLSASKRWRHTVFNLSKLKGQGKLKKEVEMILCELFEEYADFGKMSPEQYVAITGFGINSNALRSAFNEFDKDKDLYLTCEDFLALCSARLGVTEEILKINYYNDDLKKITEIEPEDIELKLLPRHVISVNNNCFSVLYSLLDLENEIAEKSWQLIRDMPTSPKRVFMKIQCLQELDDTLDKNTCISKLETLLEPKSKYKLLYNLKIIENLFTVEDGGSIKSFGREDVWQRLLSYQNVRLADHQKTAWKVTFEAWGGFEYLEDMLIQFSREPSKSGSSEISKKIIELITRILAKKSIFMK